MEDTPKPEQTLADLVRQLEAIRRDLRLVRDRLARLAEVERFRALSDAERALHTEWLAAARQLSAEVHLLEKRIQALM